MRATRVPAPRRRMLLAALVGPALLLGACATGSDAGDQSAGEPGDDGTSTVAPDDAVTSPTDDELPGDAETTGGIAGTRPSGVPSLEGLPAGLTITVDSTGSGSTQTWTLTCDPPGGTHADPEWACAAIEAAGGVEAFEPVPRDAVCTEIYGGPATAHVEGTVDGQSVNADFSRTNGCEIARWDALAGLLGDPAAA